MTSIPLPYLLGFIVWLLLLPSSAVACRPAPLRACALPEISLNIPALKRLADATEAYQGLLTQAIEESDGEPPLVNPSEVPVSTGRSSCFNIPFAVIRLQEISSFGKASQGKICAEHVELISQLVKGTLSQDSLEWGAVKGENRKARLRKSAKSVEDALARFSRKHSQ
jgi:hypothetical protein